MGTEDSPESMRRSTETTDPIDGDATVETDADDSGESDGTEMLGADDEAATISMDGESLVGVLNYLDDPQSYPGDKESIELLFEREPDTSQQNHVHEVFQAIHQVCKIADDSFAIGSVELRPEE